MTPSAVRSCSRACAALVAAAGLLVVGAGSAHAASDGELLMDVAGDGQGFVQVTDEPWLSVDDLGPGSVRTRDVVLWNTSGRRADLHLQVTELEDHENGCIGPERRVPGEQCEADGGELASWLTLELVPKAALTGSAATWAPSLAELAAEPHQVPVTIGAGEQLPLTLRLRFLPEAVNDTMTDQVAFDLRLTASHDGLPPPDVLGNDGTRDPAQTVTGPRIASGSGDGVLDSAVDLPLTGTTLPLWVLLLDLVAIVAGVALVVVGRRHRTRGEPLPA